MAKTVERVARWRKENPHARDGESARYHAAHREQRAATGLRWRQSRPDYYKDRYQRNREHFQNLNRNAKARRKQASGSHCAADIRDIRRQQKSKCANCRTRLPKQGAHVDHIVPIIRGGSNDRRNLQILCSTCNLRKGAMDPLEFARAVGKLL